MFPLGLVMLIRRLLRLLGAYRIYEHVLEREVKENPMPKHIAFILDGNRRWAVSKGLPRWAGYDLGARKAEEVVEWCFEIGVKVVTLYVLSTENIAKRRREELEKIFEVIKNYAKKAIREGRLKKMGVKVKVIGLKELLPRDVREWLERLEKETENNNKYYLNLAVAYGGREEIVEAAKALARDVVEGKVDLNEVSEDVFNDYLFTSGLPNPDLVIRTSGEARISNFLLWQVAYSELVFLDAYWPEFRRIDLLRAIRTYQKRHRRFGA